MMKQKLAFLLLFVVVFSNGQQKKYTIDWGASQIISAGSNSFVIPSFNKDHFEYSFDLGLQFIDQWEVSSEVDESSITITNIKYAPISKSDLKDLDESIINNDLNFSLKNSKARNKLFAFFQLSPIIKDSNGGYKKVISFQINYTSNTSNKLFTKQSNSTQTIFDSALSSGNWYRFYVDKSGVFRLSKSFLQSLGVNVNSVDPRTIKLYGNGGRMIPYSNAISQPIDVQENAIKFIGEQDGVFNDDDFILFYAQGPTGFDLVSKTNINCYTDKTYYYINVSPGSGKRIQPFNQPTGSVDMIINDFKDYKFYEVDEYNIALLGRRWFGDKFGIVNSRTYSFDFPDLITTRPISIVTYFASTSSSLSLLTISVNGNIVTNKNLSGVSNTNLATEAVYLGGVISNSQTVTVKLDYNRLGNPSATGYLDYISIEADRALNFQGKQLYFKNKNTASTFGIGQYVMTNAAQVSEIWDVTDIYNVSNFINTDALSDLSFTVQLGSLREYVALTPSDYYQPKLDQTTVVSNQNIKGTVFLNSQGEFQDVDYIIIAPDNMLNQANRLAQINRNQYNLNVKVYGLSEIYKEFSTGNQDIGAIRNLIKYVYDNASSPQNRIKYVCLFGDATFDYKNRLTINNNIVPSWYSYNSFNLTSSFVSDDFYGMMDFNEGNMLNSDKLDIAVGRILADTPQRANDLVDKIQAYYDKNSYGNWRNKLLVISDDVDIDWETIIQNTTDNIANTVSQQKPFVNAIKIHSDAFKQESSAGGNRYPEVNSEIANTIDNGALVVNYFGHGGEEGLASERILSKLMINDFRNFNKLNCFVTVTCEFTKFDNPFRQTAGEFVYWLKNAGSVALITTTRQIFVTTGTDFNNTLGQYLFSFSNNDTYQDHEYPSIAESLRLTKNDPLISSREQRRLVFFIGDPAMKLAIPKPNIRLTKINDIPISQPTDTLKALSYIKLAGEVTDYTGNLLGNYNGILSTTIYDKNVNRTTLANDGVSSGGNLLKLNFTTLGEVIFRGQASVKNGQFEFGFVVPKDIGIQVGFGKVSFYAEAEGLLQDQTGASVNTVKIGGINENADQDNVGPVLMLYMNDENFVSGGITNESPVFIAIAEDENGINTASGIGHDIVAILDGDETNPIILNNYYQTELDNYKKGQLTFPFRNLEPGLHTLTLKVWDVYNNSSTAEIQFVVYDEDDGLVINNVLNYPNPFVNYTEFWFNHNSSSSLDVSIQIFTVSGKLVRTINGQTTAGLLTASTLSRDIVWDGRDDFGDKIGKGVYVYKLTVYSSVLNKKVEKIEKLVIL